MSIPAHRLSQLIHAPQPQPLAAGGPPAQANVQAHVPANVPGDAADAQAGHATVHNLHQDARFAKLFQRVDVNQRNVEDFFRDRQARAHERLNLAPAEPAGLLREDAPAQAPANADPAPRDFGNYADMFTFTKEDRGLVAQLKVSDDPEAQDFTDQAYAAMRQDMQLAAEVRDADKSAFSRYLGKFKNLFRAGEAVRFEKTVGDDALEMKIRSKSSRAEGKGHEIDTSYKKEVKDRTFWSKVGFGALAVAAVAAVVVFAPAVIPALVTAVTGLGTAALVGGLVATPVLMKTVSLIKSPWWGKTVEGQIQHRERREAKELANSYATQVRAQVRGEQLNDAGEAAALPDDGGPSLPKRLLIDNPAKLNDFLQLAHENDRDALKAKVREELLSDRSHLDKNTIKQATKSVSGWFKDWGLTGNQKGHANKTVDLVAEEITRGIMRGVAEGMMDLAIARCADEMTEAAKDPLWATVKPRLDAFTQAIDRTAPHKNIHGHDVEWGIHETAEPLARLQQYKANADTLTAQVKQTLQDHQNAWGVNNVQAYAQGLDQLNADIDTHIQSLQEIQHLVGDVQEVGRQPAPVSVRHINDALSQLLMGEFADAQALDALDAKTRQDLASLRAQVQGDSRPRLVKEHAEAFEGLIGRLDQARDALLGRAKVITEARQLFKNGPMDRQALQAQLQALKALENRKSLDINPADSQALMAQFAPAEQALVALRTQAEQLDKAYGLQDELKRLQDESIQLAAGGDFGSALNRQRVQDLERNLRLQDDALKQWGNNARPADLQAAQGLDGWRMAVMTAGLKLSAEQAKPLEPVLTRLCEPDNGQLLQQLAALPQAQCLQVLSLLSQSLQNAGVGAGAPVQALSAYQALSEMDLGEASAELDLRKLTLSVFPGAIDGLNKLQALHRTVDLLARLEVTEVGRQLRQGQAQPASDLLPSLDQALSLAPEGDATVAEVVQQLLQASNGRPLSALAGDPQALLALEVSRQQFEQLIALLDVLGAPPAQPMAQKASVARAQAQALADKLRNQLRPQAMVNVLAQALAEAPAEGSDDLRVQQKVREGAALEQEADRAQALALNQQLMELKDLQQLRQDQREDNLKTLQRNAQKLHGLLGLPASFSHEQLIQKISSNRELAHEINLLMGALETLEGQDVPAGLRNAFTPQQLLTGAQALAQLPPWPDAQIKLVHKQDRAQARRMQERNALIKQFSGESNEQLARLLENKKTAQQVEVFLNEQRALAALHQASKSSLPMAAFRALVGQAPTAGAAGSAQHTKAQREQALAMNHMHTVHQQLKDGLQPRLAAVQELIAASESQFITSQSNYLVAQIPAHHEQIDSAEAIHKAMVTPAAAELAALGQKLREADTLHELTGGDASNLARIKMHFLKGQHDASMQALKYLNLDKFEANRPGLFGRLLYKMLNRGERLQRLIHADTRRQAGELLGLSASQLTGDAVLEQQLRLVQATIRETQKRHDALFEKPENVALAYALLVTERLAAKSADGMATFEAPDAAEVDKQWQALMGESAPMHSHALDSLRQGYLGKNTQAIEEGLNDEQFNAVAKEVSHLLAKRAEIAEVHRQFRQNIVQGKLTGPRKMDGLQSSAIKAGLDADDLETVRQLGKAGILNERRLNTWALAMELATTKPGQALVEATAARERVRLGLRDEEIRVAALEKSVAALMDQVSRARKDDPTLQKKLQDTSEEFMKASTGLEQLRINTGQMLAKLENRFLQQLGEQAPTRLADPDEVHPDLNEHLKLIHKMERAIGQGQSIKPDFIEKAWEQLQTVLPKFSTDLLDAEKAPESLADIALAADLNFRLGAVAYKSMANLPRQAGANDEIRQQYLNKLQSLVTVILKAAEKPAMDLDGGVGKWHCPPSDNRKFAYGNPDSEDRMGPINRMLSTRVEDRFHHRVANEDDEVNAMDVAVDNA